jgi:hypoxanthine phosphoribosyltransferase
MISIDSIEPLIPEVRIGERVKELARQIQSDYAGEDLVVISVLGGSVIFLADLVRKLNLPVRIDTVSISSYTGQSVAPGQLKVLKTFSEDVRGKNVLIVDDILDTGETLRAVVREVAAMEPKSLKTCIFVVKKRPRSVEISPDYAGFEIPDDFVVGYGMDFNGMYRNLPYLAVLKGK